MLEPVYLARLDWRRVMTTLEARLAVSQDPDERRLLLRRLSKLHEEQDEDYRAALETIAKLLAEDVTDEATWAELERLARVANAEGRLAEIYAGELGKVTADEPATARLAKRTGELFEAQKDVERALSFYRRAYAFAPEANARRFEAIDRLLREAGRPAERVALYRDALEYRTDPSSGSARSTRSRTSRRPSSSDDDAAIDTYRAALDVDEADLHALEALVAPLRAPRAVAGSRRSHAAPRRAERAAGGRGEPAPAAREAPRTEARRDARRRSTSSRRSSSSSRRPSDGPGAEAVTALEELLQTPEHKARVVEILRPIYERADDWRHLVAVNEQRLMLATQAGEKVAILRETAKLWEQRGGDRRRAFDAIRQALDARSGRRRHARRSSIASPRRRAVGRPRGCVRGGDRRRSTA